MDVDAVVAKMALDEIQDILGGLPHGEREEIADEIIEFKERLKKKYLEELK